MAHFQLVVLLLTVLAAVSAEPLPQGNNQYLPPDEGYKYNKPSIPFPNTPQRPSTDYRPPPVPQQPYRPPSPRPVSPSPRPPVFNTPPSPTYGTPPPSYRPPQPTYIPPPQSTYRPPPPPVYKPPQQTQSTYRPPVYKPPQQTQSTYRPPPPTYNQPPTPTYGPPQNTYRPSPPPSADHGGDHTGDHSHGHGHGDHVHEAGMPYEFNYAVQDARSGADYSQNEVSDGDQVKGEYRVNLPDGRLQIVRYTADWKTGFHADVSYEGEAKYPDFVPSASRPASAIADRPSGGYNYPSPGQTNPPTSYGPPSTGGPY